MLSPNHVMNEIETQQYEITKHGDLEDDIP